MKKARGLRDDTEAFRFLVTDVNGVVVKEAKNHIEYVVDEIVFGRVRHVVFDQCYLGMFEV